jgi:ABC-type bacteriocin/lantibiotic exporters, contain an N-terminal double-glycine peptidase domain
MVLDGIDLELTSGERVAVVGPSGVGKSTLLTTILGLTPSSAGSIALGDIFQAEADAEWWRAQFAYVPQAPHLFAGTLMNNLFLGTSERPSSDEHLRRALEVARLSALVAGLPDGLATEIGEGGERLSAGECQRVAIARALLRVGASVVILDEPTAHLDVATEAELAVRLDAAIEGRILLMVTHRRRMLELVDRVVVLDGGRISEDVPNSMRRPRLVQSTDGPVSSWFVAESEMFQ